MSERDPWEIFDSLSPEAKEQVYQEVKDVRMAPRAQANRMSKEEFSEVEKLYEVLKQERERRELGRVLKRFLPEQ